MPGHSSVTCAPKRKSIVNLWSKFIATHLIQLNLVSDLKINTIWKRIRRATQARRMCSATNVAKRTAEKVVYWSIWRSTREFIQKCFRVISAIAPSDPYTICRITEERIRARSHSGKLTRLFCWWLQFLTTVFFLLSDAMYANTMLQPNLNWIDIWKLSHTWTNWTNRWPNKINILPEINSLSRKQFGRKDWSYTCMPWVQ